MSEHDQIYEVQLNAFTDYIGNMYESCRPRGAEEILKEIKGKRSVREIAQKSRFSTATVNRYLYGQTPPCREFVIALCCMAGMTVEQTDEILRQTGTYELYAKSVDDCIYMYMLSHNVTDPADTFDVLSREISGMLAERRFPGAPKIRYDEHYRNVRTLAAESFSKLAEYIIKNRSMFDDAFLEFKRQTVKRIRGMSERREKLSKAYETIVDYAEKRLSAQTLSRAARTFDRIVSFGKPGAMLPAGRRSANSMFDSKSFLKKFYKVYECKNNDKELGRFMPGREFLVTLAFELEYSREETDCLLREHHMSALNSRNSFDAAVINVLEALEDPAPVYFNNCLMEIAELIRADKTEEADALIAKELNADIPLLLAFLEEGTAPLRRILFGAVAEQEPSLVPSLKYLM